MSFLCAVSLQAQIPRTLSNEDKVYGLSKFWQEVNYNFVYLEKVDRAKWDSTYRAMISIVQKTENDYEYYRELQRFCALLKDGHTNVNFPRSIDTLIMNAMFGKYRLFITNIDNKAIITRTNLSMKDEVPIGSEIVDVNGLPTREYIKRYVAPYFSSSTEYALQDLSFARLLQGLRGEKYDIKIKTPSGVMKTLSLVHERTSEEQVYPPFETRELLDFRWYGDQIAYVALNSFGSPRIDTLFVQKLPELYKAKGLIIDLRYNGGGSTGIGTEILQYLTNDPLLYGSRQITRLHMPAHKAWGKWVTPKDTVNNAWQKKSYLHYLDKAYYEFEYSPDSNKATGQRVVVPTALLIGHNTASAAEDFLIYADRQKHMVKIGENSYGSTGQPLMFDLPGGGSARVCTKKDTYPDGREFVGYGVKPDIEVKPTVNDFVKKNDPALTRALEYLKERIRYVLSANSLLAAMP